MAGVQIVFPDTGEAAWWCICAENECEVQAFGPHRTRESAQAEARTSSCDNAHFVTDRVGPQMRLRRGQVDWLLVDDWLLVQPAVVAHNERLVVKAAR